MNGHTSVVCVPVPEKNDVTFWFLVHADFADYTGKTLPFNFQYSLTPKFNRVNFVYKTNTVWSFPDIATRKKVMPTNLTNNINAQLISPLNEQLKSCMILFHVSVLVLQPEHLLNQHEKEKHFYVLVFSLSCTFRFP